MNCATHNDLAAVAFWNKPAAATREFGLEVFLVDRFSCGARAAHQLAFAWSRKRTGSHQVPRPVMSIHASGRGELAVLRILGSPRRLCDGLSRRDFLHVGGLGLLGAAGLNPGLALVGGVVAVPTSVAISVGLIVEPGGPAVGVRVGDDHPPPAAVVDPQAHPVRGVIEALDDRRGPPALGDGRHFLEPLGN